MKKLVSLILALMLAASLAAFASAEEDAVYGTATLTYAELYSGEVSSTDAIDGVLGAMVERNTTNVDTVSSATTSSDALIEAVRKALDKAIPE